MDINTSDECVATMLHALPFADNDAGLKETAELIRKLKMELDAERAINGDLLKRLQKISALSECSWKRST